MPLVERCHKIGVTPAMIEIISLIPYAHRDASLKRMSTLISILEQNLPLDGLYSGAFSGALYEIVEILGVLPDDLRQAKFNDIITLIENDLSILREILPPLAEDSFSTDLLQQYLQDEEVGHKILAYWTDILNKCPDKAKAQKLVEFITDYYEEIGLYEEHLLVQNAIRVGTLLETSNDPLNPFRFFEEVKRKRAEVIDLELIKPRVETLEGITFHFSPQFFRDAIPQYLLIFGQLPKHSKDFLKSKVKQLDQLQQQEEDSFNEAVEEITEEQTYQELKKDALGDHILENYLKLNGAFEEKVPSLVAARFMAIVAYLESYSDHILEGKLLSPQQEAFLKLLVSIQGCPFGKDEGTNAYYLNILPQEFRLIPTAQDETGDVYYLKMKSEVSAHLAIEIEKMFSGQNIFAKSLAGMKDDEEIEQASHTATYLKNIIGDMVLGLKLPRFDSASQLLPKDLVDKSKLEMLQAFYKYFPASRFVFSIAQKYDLSEGETIERLEEMGILTILSSVKKATGLENTTNNGI
jgi:hypothetical protein